jgi:hypothetical protein
MVSTYPRDAITEEDLRRAVALPLLNKRHSRSNSAAAALDAPKICPA